jgi:hypothetical protein
VVHTPSEGLLRRSDALQQLGNPLRGLGWWCWVQGRLEALWRGKWLFLWITPAGADGVECFCAQGAECRC